MQRRAILKALMAMFGFGTAKAVAALPEVNQRESLETIVCRAVLRETKWDFGAWHGTVHGVCGNSLHARRVAIIRELENQAVIVEFFIDVQNHGNVSALVSKAIEQIRETRFMNRGVLRVNLK